MTFFHLLNRFFSGSVVCVLSVFGSALVHFQTLEASTTPNSSTKKISNLAYRSSKSTAHKDKTVSNKCCKKPIIEARVSYFRPFSKTFRQIYHNGGVDYALETTVPLWHGINLWGSVDYFSKRGEMIGIDRSTHITLVPITLGLKYLYAVNSFYGVYGGLAPKYYFVQIVNRSSPVYRTTHRYGLGGVIEAGNLFYLHKHCVLDIFTSCSFKRVRGLSHLPPNATCSSLQVGGWNIGGALGYSF